MSWNRPPSRLYTGSPSALPAMSQHAMSMALSTGVAMGPGCSTGVAPEHVPPDALPAHRISPLQDRFEDLLRHLQRRPPVGAVPGALAGALDAVVGNQLDEQPVFAALAGRRHRHEVPLEPLDLHASDGSWDHPATTIHPLECAGRRWW